MSKMKKYLLTGISYVLVAALAIGGTIAYLQDSDEDVNVMTLGSAKINQFEKERTFDEAGNVTGMQDFTQGQALYPAVVTNGTGNEAWAPNSNVDIYYKDYLGDKYPGGNGTWQNLNNTMDKFVFVENTGKSDVYYRTIILYEYDETNFKNTYGQGLIHFNVNGHNLFDWSPEIGDQSDDTLVVEVAGEKYGVLVATYTAALTPGEISRPSLLEVGMDQLATNEHYAQFGETYDILVLSQAVQTAGFDGAAAALDTAFGEINAENIAEWFEGTKVPEVVDKDSINDALEEGKDIVFGDDLDVPANESNAYGKTSITVQKGQVIDGGNKVLKAVGADGKWDTAINAYGGTVKNLTVAQGFRGLFINHSTDHPEKCGEVVLEKVIIDGCTYTISCDQGTNNGLSATNCTFNGWTSYAATLGDAKFVDCSFGEGNGYAYCRPFAPTEFVGCDFEAGYAMDPRAAVTFENCTLGGEPLTAANLATLVTSNIANATVK